MEDRYTDGLIRTFIEVPLFSKRWAEIGLGDDELLALQIMLLKDPQSGPVMEGTGGIRKVRFPLENRGKSGGVRVCYADFEEYEVTYLITAFTKDEQSNLTKEEKNVLKKLVKALKDEAAVNRGRK
ncbi:RelE toxin of RelE / RelB toxin-antitoxin system [Lachnospiraceae bacterium XBB2008]|nr:type II toxin-antitoxin system RelE/ParE family toxin [Lachnospiraceae bacterium]SCY72796.1 RelE toxin of RelE / RelB toxin-antitoxin system [Lachnospiraceae bacterium XBB2008]